MLAFSLAFLLLLVPSAPASTSEWLAQHSTASSPVRELLRLFHARQHPPRAACSRTRLLLVHLDDENFEGLGSLTGELVQSLGEAMHANRTLIWGVGLPFLLDRTRDEWSSPRGPRSTRSVWTTPSGAPISLDCSTWEGYGGGAWACFFRKLSSCSLDDATPDELRALGENPYDDTARLKLIELRRGVAGYTVPRWDSELAAAAGSAMHPRHAWAASLAAYIFRLKPEVEAAAAHLVSKLYALP